jgi:hypothetical protein
VQKLQAVSDRLTELKHVEPQASVYLSATYLTEECQSLHQRDVIDLALVDNFDILGQIGPTGPGPPPLGRLPYLPQIKFTSQVLTKHRAIKAITLPNDSCLA